MILYILYGFLILTTIVVIILAGKGIFTVDKPKPPKPKYKSDPKPPKPKSDPKPPKPKSDPKPPKSKSDPKPKSDPISDPKSEPCINPVPFHTGFINDLPPHQKLANLCCNDVMYPINPIYVNYGLPIRSDCDVNIFNSQP
jgi:hypothetical protein